jgi:tetratricopeptide (TPR) repeat protein
MSRAIDDSEGEAACLQQLGQIAVQQEDFSGAQKYLDHALEIATRLGFDRIQAVCEWRLGMVALFTKDMSRADAHITKSLDLSRRQLDTEMVAMSLLMLGNIALWQDRLNEAEANLTESLEILRPEGSSRSIANLLESLAAVAVAQGNVERALTLGGSAEGLRQQIAIISSSPFHREISMRLEAARQSANALDAWRSGAQMSRDQAITYALGEKQAG